MIVSAPSRAGAVRAWTFFLLLCAAGTPAPALTQPADAGADLARELSALRRRAATVSPHTPAARVLARDLGQIGRGYLELGETGRAVELLEEAYGWDEENGLVLAALTLAYVRSENFPFARFYLELAEQRAAQAPPEVYATLGDVYYGLNRVEDAVLAWEQFERLRGNDPDVLRRLSRARQELALTHGQKVLQLEDFAIYFDAAIPPPLVERLSEHLAESYASLSDFFQARLPASQVVILYAGRAYFSLVSIPDWVGGVFDGKIRVSMDPDTGAARGLEAVLRHELAHAFIRYVSRDRAPGWLHEGLAQWCEGKRLPPRDLREIFKGRRPASLAEMEQRFGNKTERSSAQANYAQSLGLVEYLAQYRGEGALLCILRSLAEGHSLEEALQSEASLTGAELVSGWKAWAGV